MLITGITWSRAHLAERKGRFYVRELTIADALYIQYKIQRCLRIYIVGRTFADLISSNDNNNKTTAAADGVRACAKNTAEFPGVFPAELRKSRAEPIRHGRSLECQVKRHATGA